MDKVLVLEAEEKGKSNNLTASQQIEHWAKIGKVMEENPDLTYQFVKESLLSKSEFDSGDFKHYKRRT
ncbi:TA system antitoxin ParD family protein [Vibrio parahaemolyticus]|uniref:TA system antitoxin ParD family protein n=1 Tax=Vibrio parahaemolyticus TaxID=670 RepID=UPI0031CCD7F6